MKKSMLLVSSFLISSALLSGAALAQGAPPSAPPSDGPWMERPMTPPMSEAGQKIMHETMEASRKGGKAIIEALQTKDKEADALLKAATFDKKAYLAKKAEMRALHEKLALLHDEAFVTAASKMTAEDRAVLAERPRGPHGPMKGGHPGRRGGGPDGAAPMAEGPAE